MTGNPLPWFVLAAIVAASLAWKGYLKFPSTAKDNDNSAPGVSGQTPADSNQGVGVDALAKLSSSELGLLYHKALKAEAESEMLEQMAKDRSALIKERLIAPFSPPEPAGSDTNQAGEKP